MARYRESYSLYSRKTKSGKKVYYYRTYCPLGKRTSGKSTGCINKSAARQYCEELIKLGKLYNGSSTIFFSFAENFFDEKNLWFQENHNQTGKKISESTVLAYKSALKNHIMPYFQNIKLIDIKTSSVKLFKLNLIKKGLSPSTINLTCQVLRIIISTAVDDNLITTDPFRKFKQLECKRQLEKAFTLEEIKRIVNFDFNNKKINIFFLVAATTGMRKSEIMAVRKETIFSDHILVKDQFLREKYLPTKNKKERKIPICLKLYEMLCNYLEDRSIVFEKYSRIIYYHFQKVIKTIPDYVERELCVHSFRHFFNTYLLAENISSAKVAAVLGHNNKDNVMQNLYTSWKPELMPEIYAAQEKLLDNIIEIKIINQ